MKSRSKGVSGTVDPATVATRADLLPNEGQRGGLADYRVQSAVLLVVVAMLLVALL